MRLAGLAAGLPREGGRFEAELGGRPLSIADGGRPSSADGGRFPAAEEVGRGIPKESRLPPMADSRPERLTALSLPLRLGASSPLPMLLSLAAPSSPLAREFAAEGRLIERRIVTDAGSTSPFVRGEPVGVRLLV